MCKCYSDVQQRSVEERIGQLKNPFGMSIAASQLLHWDPMSTVAMLVGEVARDNGGTCARVFVYRVYAVYLFGPLLSGKRARASKSLDENSVRVRGCRRLIRQMVRLMPFRNSGTAGDIHKP